ncbi:filamentous hemagglutinin N-terminal domain-containing protein [Erwinia psidii]|uniref:two-partner secretion domain-containing protein n=1 Tax=Erwinia psidii TaxID=69224 RepID=UPI00226B87EF|nr:hemagglutinin repeat-containing protein [Erwinia psidii]MCX8965208.1 filamentous hemagglutinin N-terminal domain-containing protein [Erwinia psidii]
MKHKKKLIHRRFKRHSLRVSPLVLAMASIIPNTSVAEIIIDESTSRRPGIASAANGTPLININDPNTSGVSHNKYNQFNVGSDGVIFNNSMQDGVSSIGGFSMKNSQLSNEAKVILNEVTGAAGSHLNGAMEVFGASADLIIANENGITVNGVSTINANNLTLSTGQASLDQNGNVQLAVEKGNITVEGRGINTDGLSYFDIVSRSASLTGEISGNADVKVVTGLNDYDTPSRTHQVRSKTGEGTPQVAISGSNLGSMFGNRIQLISTETGAGVTHTGSIVGNNSIEITADGEIRLASLNSKTENVTVAGRSIYLNNNTETGTGGIGAQGDVILTALADMELNANVIAETGQLRINAASLLQSAAVLIAKSSSRSSGAIPGIEINVAGRYQIKGSLYAVDSNGNKIQDAVVTISNGKYLIKVGSTVIANATVYSDANLISTSGDININAGVVENNQSTIMTSKGNLIFNLTDSLINNGLVQASGSVQLNAGRFKNAGIIYTTDAMKLTLGTLENTGSMYAGNLTVNTENLTNSGVILTSEGDLSLKVKTKTDNSGDIQSAHAVIVDSQDVENTGQIYARERVDMALSGDLVNEGDLYAEASISLDADNVKNSGVVITKEGNLSLRMQNQIDNSGTFQAGSSMTLAGKKLTNDGNIYASQAVDAVVTGDLENAGKIYADDIKLVSTALRNKGDVVAEKGNISIKVTGDTDVVNSGSVRSKTADIVTAGALTNQGTIGTTDSLTVTSKNLTNNSKVISEGKLTLTLDDELVNSGSESVIYAGKGMDINGKDKGTLKIKNSGGAFIQSQTGNINVTDIASLENTDSTIISGSDVIIAGVKIVENNNGIIQGDNVTFSQADKLKNDGNNAKIIASSALKISDVSNVINSGTLGSHGNIDVANIDLLQNESGNISASGNIDFKAVNSLENNNAAKISSTYGSVIFDTLKSLKNLSSSIISAREKISITNIDTVENSDESYLYSEGNITLSEINKLDNAAKIISGLNLVINGMDSFINKGQYAQVFALNIIISKVSSFINRDYAWLIADGTIKASEVKDFKNVLSFDDVLQTLDDAATYISANNIDLDVENFISSGYGSQIISDNNFKINANQIGISDEAILASDNTLSVTTDSLLNDGGVIDGANYSINAKSLINKGQISSGNSNGVSTITSDSIDNKEGRINNAGYLTVKTSALDNSQDGYIWSNRMLFLDLQGDFNNADYNVMGAGAGGLLAIKTTGDVTIDKTIESKSTVSIDAKSITNNKAVVSLENVYLAAENIINSTNALIFAMNNIVINATDTILNKLKGNILSQGQIAFTADTIHNHGGIIRSEKNMFLDANKIYNQSTYKGDEWDYSASETGTKKHEEGDNCATWCKYHEVTITIPGLTSDIALDTQAEISSGGNLYINQEDEKPGVIYNEGGLIQSSGSMFVRGDLYNAPKYLEISLYDYINLKSEITLSYKHWTVMGGGRPVSSKFSSLYDMLNLVFGDGTITGDKYKYVNAMKELANSHTLLNDIMNRLFGQTWKADDYSVLVNTWQELTASANEVNSSHVWDEDLGDYVGESSVTTITEAKLKAKKRYLFPSDSASIVAGGNFVHEDGSFNNGLDLGIDNSITENKTVDVNVGEETVSTIEQSYEVTFNKKKMAEISMGISTLPGISELLEINSLFEKSQEFLNHIASLINGRTDAVGALEANISTSEKGTNTVVPMYETRIEMIDQSQFYGSKYFFDAVGYNSTQPVVVIGDNYFISELIRRQVNDSVGTYFSVKYNVDGADMVKMFFDNAAEQAASSDFVIGNALTEEQMAGLTEDIVWFVTESVDGVDVLVPRIYLASSTIEEIKVASETGAAIVSAGANVIIDASEINNVNAVIKAGNHAVLTAENDVNNISSGMNSGISAGGTVAITSNSGDINNSGSSISAGEHVILSAEEGKINLIASVGRDDAGNQLIGAYDDGITAGGSIQMTAKDIDITAVGLTAGDSVFISATEGSVNFNDIHEVSSDYSYQHDATGLMSYRTEENTSANATSKTSSVNAGGAFIVNAAQDVVFSGGDYQADASSITAGNDVVIKASKDVSHSEQRVTESELTFGYKYQVPGASGGGSVSSLDSLDQGGADVASAISDSASATIDTGMEKYDQYTDDSGYSSNTPSITIDTGTEENDQYTDESGYSSNTPSITIDTGTEKYNQYTDDSGYSSNGPSNDKTASAPKKAGAAQIAPSGNFEAGLKTTETVTTESSVTYKNANFNFANGANINAGNTLDIGGMDLSVGDDATANFSADNITSTKYRDTVKKTEEVTTTFIGVKGEANSTPVDILAKNADLVEQSQEGKKIDGGLTAASAAGDVTNLLNNDLVAGSLSAGWSSTTTKSSSLSETDNINNISGGTINFTSKNDTSLKGVAINANNINLDVGGDFSLSAAESSYTASSSTVSQNANLAFSGGAAISGAGVGSSYSYSESSSESQTDAKTYTNSEMNAANVNVKVKGDMTMSGANISADQVDVDVAGDLSVSSVQDTYSERSEGYNYHVSGGLSVTTNGLLPNIEAGYGVSESSYESKLTNQQSGIHSSGNVNIKVGGDANLAGSHIISDTQSGTMDVGGSINVTEVNDSVDSSGYSAGGGGGISTKGNIYINGYYTTEDTIDYKETQKSSINFDVSNNTVNGDVNTDADNMSTITKDEVTAGNDISFTLGGSAKKKNSTAGGTSGKTSKNTSSKNNTSNKTKTNTNSKTNPGSSVPDGGGSGSSNKKSSGDTSKSAKSKSTDNSQYATQKPGSSDAKTPQKPTSTDNSQYATQKPGSSDAPTLQKPTVSKDSTGTSETSNTGAKKWPTVQPSKPIIGGPGSSSSIGGNYAGHTRPANNSPAANRTAASNTSNNSASDGASSSSGSNGVKKWPTVQPAKPIIGGPGSSSSISGNYAGNARPANNSPAQAKALSSDSASVKPANESDAATKWKPLMDNQIIE